MFPSASRPSDQVKLAVLQRINRDRAGQGLAPVEWDEAASRVADAFCAQQVAEKSRGHFLMDGVPPYSRTGFAGVFGMQSENSISWVTTASHFSEPLVQLALLSEEEMMREKPPQDGHRRTILDPQSTHVGVGYAASHGRFQMAEEFLVRTLEQLRLAPAGSPRALVKVDGKPLSNERLRFVLVAREPEPAPLTRQEATARTSYSYPKPDLAYIPHGLRDIRVDGVGNDDRIRMHEDGRFSFLYELERPGLYTFVFYLSTKGRPARPGASACLWVEEESG